MSNPHRGDLPIEVGGVSYTLCYDLNACAMVMDRLGFKTFESMTEADNVLAKAGMMELRYILWAGLRRHHASITEEEVGAMEWDLNLANRWVAECFQRGILVTAGGSDQATEGPPLPGTGSKPNS